MNKFIYFCSSRKFTIEYSEINSQRVFFLIGFIYLYLLEWKSISMQDEIFVDICVRRKKPFSYQSVVILNQIISDHHTILRNFNLFRKTN